MEWCKTINAHPCFNNQHVLFFYFLPFYFYIFFKRGNFTAMKCRYSICPLRVVPREGSYMTLCSLNCTMTCPRVLLGSMPCCAWELAISPTGTTLPRQVSFAPPLLSSAVGFCSFPPVGPLYSILTVRSDPVMENIAHLFHPL